MRDATPQAVSKNEDQSHKDSGLRHGEKYTDTSAALRSCYDRRSDQMVAHQGFGGQLITSSGYGAQAGRNFVQQFITPIVKATKGKKRRFFHTVPEYEAWKQSHDGAKGWKTSTTGSWHKHVSGSRVAAALEKAINMVHSGDKCDGAIDLAFSVAGGGRKVDAAAQPRNRFRICRRG